MHMTRQMTKTGKFVVAASASALLLAAGNSQASINWDTFPYSLQSEYVSYNFEVQQNGGQFLNTEGYVFGESSTSNSASSYADIVKTSPNTAPLGSVLSMKAGSQGTGTSASPPDGLSIQSFAEMTFTGFDDSTLAIVSAQQQATTNALRRLTVDTAGFYNFSANLLGQINYPDEYLVSDIRITASFSGFIYNGPGSELTSLTDDTTLDFDLIGGDPSQNADVYLQSQTASGKPIFYQMGIGIYFNTNFSNLNWLEGSATPIDFLDEDGNGHIYIGTETDPLKLTCALTPAAPPIPTPLPGAALLLFSGLSSLAFFRRKAKA